MLPHPPHKTVSLVISRVQGSDYVLGRPMMEDGRRDPATAVMKDLADETVNGE